MNRLREADAMLAGGKSVAQVIQHLGASERGSFRAAARDATHGAARVELTRRELAMMLEGIDERNTAKSRRFACTAAQRVYV